MLFSDGARLFSMAPDHFECAERQSANAGRRILMVSVTRDQLLRIAPNARGTYLDGFQDVDAVLGDVHINDRKLRIAHFLAQVLQETGGLTILRENMNYSAERLLVVFKNRVTAGEAPALAHHPEQIANKVYGGRADLGNNQPDDGFKFIGRGMLQITGRDSYQRAGDGIGANLVNNPDLAFDPQFALKIAAWEWNDKKCNDPADADNVTLVTRRINGGVNGLADRKEWLKKTKAVWN
jgi:putative chitinase